MKKPKAKPGSGGSRYWRDLSDEQLLEVAFTTDDPEDLADLVEDVPDTDDVILEFAYDFRGSKRKFIRCAHCKFPNHLAGFVIKAKDGRRFLAGHNCGEKIYGASFKTFRKDFDAARNRASNLHRMRNMQAALPAFLEYLGKLRIDPAFTLYQQTRQQIRTQAPRLYGALQLATARHDGALAIEERVRDYEAEAREEARYDREMEEWNKETVTERKKLRRDGYEPDKPKKPLYTTVQKRIGTVSAPTLFAVAANPKQFVNDIASQFDNLAAAPAISSHTAQTVFAWQGRGDNSNRNRLRRWAQSGRDIGTTLKQIGPLLDQIEQQIDRLEELSSFFQPGTLAAVAQWATANDLAGVYKAGLNSLTFTNDDGEEITIRVPPDYKVPSKAALLAFREATNKI